MSAEHFETNRAAMIEYIEGGSKRPEDFKLGLELEHFIIDEKGEPVTYEQENGVRAILEQLVERLGEPLMVDGNLMGVAGSIGGVGFTITLEPASQFEVSLGPVMDIELIEDAYLVFRDAVAATIEDLGVDYALVTAGYNPARAAREMPIIDKQRYHLMDAHFKSTGQCGIEMMRGTASTQVSIDYSSQRNAVRRYRLAVALGPLIALVTDNSPVYQGEINRRRMIRSHIWRDTDAVRCGIVPGTFDEGFGFERYVDWLLSVPPILCLDEAGVTSSTGSRLMGDIIADKPVSRAQIEHLFSMVFPDVRIKRFIEIRDADSIPPSYALGLLALIKGLFNQKETCCVALDVIGEITERDVVDARTALMADGYDAIVYGQEAGELLDKLLVLAADALDADDRRYLDPLAELIHARTTLREMALEEMDRASVTEADLDEEYLSIVRELDGDIDGRLDAQAAMDDGYAIRNGKAVPWSFSPKLYTARTTAEFAHIAETTHRIMEKATAHYLASPEYRALFDFDAELEELILLDPGYERLIPLARVDIFYDERTGDFKFCEFNTDGSSGMTFITEANAALARTETLRRFAEQHEISEYPLHDAWVEAFLDVYESSENAVERPTVAIVDYLESIMMGDANLYRETFEEHGVKAYVVDIRDLVYENGHLKDAEGSRIDVIWRRAVTSEMVEKGGAGADAMVAAARDGNVTLIGSFRTWPAAVKDFLTILDSDASAAFLTDEEREFISAHTPKTYVLDADLDPAPFLEDPTAWIIKPREGYGGTGVMAGIDHADPEEWARLIAELAPAEGHVIQEYVTPYRSEVLLPGVTDGTMDEDLDPLETTTVDNLVGLYVFDGEFGGIFSRAGSKATITSHTESINLPTFIVDE